MTHTQGAWFVDDFGEVWIMTRLANGRDIYLATVTEGDELGLYEKDSEKRAGNAHLMAAAPDLLAVAREIVAYEEGRRGGLSACVILAKAAIRKAEGAMGRVE